MKGIITKLEGSRCYDGIDKITNVYLKLLFQAILEVDEQYFHTKHPDKRIKGLYNHLERVFAYELYHQWSILQSAYNDGVRDDEKRIVNGEIGKKMDNVSLFPDLVLHKGHDDLHNQEIIVEIKRKKWMRKKSILSDLDKISKFMKEGFLSYSASKYKEGVFIVIDGDENDIKNQFINIANKDFFNPRIYCVFCKGDNSLKYITLNELL